MPWIGRKKIAFVPVHRPNAHPPDDPVPADWPNEIRRRVFYDPDPTSKEDRSLRAFIHKASSGRADLEGIVMPMQIIDQQDVTAGTIDPILGPQLRSQGFEAGAMVMLGGPGAGTASGFWARFVMQERLGTWAMELMHVLTGFPDIRPVPGLLDSPNGEGNISNFDEMGANLGMHPTAYTKKAIRWLDPTAIAIHPLGSASNYDLHAVGLVQPPPFGRHTAVRIGSFVPYLMVEARLMVDQFESRSTLEPGIRNEGVIVYRIQTTDPLGHSQNNKLAVFLLTSDALRVGGTFTADTGVIVSVQAAIAGGFRVNVNDPNPPPPPPTQVTVPHVMGLFASQAKHEIEVAGLVAQLDPSATSHSWVASQSPVGGTVVAPGSVVKLTTRTGPVP